MGKESTLPSVSATAKELSGYFPVYEEEIQIIATGHANSTKYSLLLLALPVAYGQMQNRVTALAPGFVIAAKYDMMGKELQLTIRYKYGDIAVQLANSLTSGLDQALSFLGVGPVANASTLLDPLFTPVDESLVGATPKFVGLIPAIAPGIANPGPKYQTIYGNEGNPNFTKTAPGIYSSQAIAGPYGPGTLVEPLPPGDGKSRGTFLELLLYNTLNRPAQIVQSGTVAPGVRTQGWNNNWNEKVGIPPTQLINTPRTAVPFATVGPVDVAAGAVVDATNNGFMTSGTLQPGDFIGVPVPPSIPPVPNPPDGNGIITDMINGLLVGYG